MLIYGYARVSTKDQNLDRQLVELQKYTDKIYSDKESGKDFERISYKKLTKKLKKGDLLVIKSIDRLGRDYDMILEEWKKITHDIGADIKVLDMPLLDTSKTEGLTGKFISDLVLQILSYVAETERQNTRQRQREGIQVAKEKGVRFGRPRKREQIDHYCYLYLQGLMKAKDALEQSGVSRGTFFTRVKEIRNESR